MKVLWVTFALLGRASELFNNVQTQGGGWIDSNIECLSNYLDSISLTIIALGSINRKIRDSNGVTYIELSDIKKNRGRINPNDIVVWKKIIRKINPDLIQVFGIEYSNGLDIITASDGVPVIFYIQGLMNSFLPYKDGSLSLSDYINVKCVNGLIKLPKVSYDYNVFKRQARIEEKIIKQCDGVIIDGNWTERYLRSFSSNVVINKAFLPVSKCFLNMKWNRNNTEERHSIFTIAGRSPYKGLHILIKAVGLLINKYPDIKIYIPGNMNYKNIITKPGYISYINALINKMNLSGNIFFIGQLSQQQMAEYMLKSSLFVMPSCVENHSSTLREAMYIGMPCISSNVGCISEIVVNGENALIYRYEEYQQLAGCIDDVFTNKELQSKIASNAYDSIRKKYPQDIIGTQLYDIYNKYCNDI